KLNLVAGKLSLRSAAYATAMEYLRHARALCPADVWVTDYPLARETTISLGKCEYLAGSVETAQTLLSEAADKSQTVLEKAEVQRFRIVCCTALAQHTMAVQTALDALRGLGVELPPKPSQMQVIVAFVRVTMAVKK